MLVGTSLKYMWIITAGNLSEFYGLNSPLYGTSYVNASVVEPHNYLQSALLDLDIQLPYKNGTQISYVMTQILQFIMALRRHMAI